MKRVFIVLLIFVAALLFLLLLPLSSSAHNTITKPLLGTASSFAVLGASTVTNTGPSVLYGDLGVDPGSAITGFSAGPGIVHGATHIADGVALIAQNDVKTAYNTIANQASSQDMTGVDLGNQLLVAGVYHFSSSAQLTGALTLDGKGNPASLFLFQIGSTLTTATSASVVLLNGAQPCNVFWQIGSSATIGTDTAFQGNILALASITANTDATFNGGLYARTGAITLDDNTVTQSPCGQSTATPTVTPTKTPGETPPPPTATPTAAPVKQTGLPNTGSDPNPHYP